VLSPSVFPAPNRDFGRAQRGVQSIFKILSIFVDTAAPVPYAVPRF
jgi:hypothetical protein